MQFDAVARGSDFSKACLDGKPPAHDTGALTTPMVLRLFLLPVTKAPALRKAQLQRRVQQD